MSRGTSKQEKEAQLARKRKKSKKAYESDLKAQRTVIPWNTGTRIHDKTGAQKRQKSKHQLREAQTKGTEADI